MAEFVERVLRKALSVRNKIFKPDIGEIQELCKLIQKSPTGREEIQEWAQRFATLLDQSVLRRVSKKDLSLILAGLVSYRNSGVTPQVSHIALMKAYESSSGLMQELLHQILFPKIEIVTKAINSQFFGLVSAEELGKISDELDRDGYVVLKRRLSQEVIDAMTEEARQFEYSLRDAAVGERETRGRKIDPQSPPNCVAAYADSGSLNSSTLFREFCADPALLHIASAHMKSLVMPIDSTLWYSFASSKASADAAQMFHYDLDTLKWLKVFVYLTDVGPTNGPHEYVPASHNPGTKPRALMDRDYARLDDEEVDTHYPDGRRSICGSKGTVIIGDTRCLHKGNAVQEGYRLIFSPIFAASRVGYFHGL
jgi:hypothetical protein